MKRLFLILLTFSFCPTANAAKLVGFGDGGDTTTKTRTLTTPDSGDGGPAQNLTFAHTPGFVGLESDCEDVDTCEIAPSKVGVKNGEWLCVSTVSANATVLKNIAGQVELGSGLDITINQDDPARCIRFSTARDRWVQMGDGGMVGATEVTSAGVIPDNRLMKGDGGVRGVQASLIQEDDTTGAISNTVGPYLVKDIQHWDLDGDGDVDIIATVFSDNNPMFQGNPATDLILFDPDEAGTGGLVGLVPGGIQFFSNGGAQESQIMDEATRFLFQSLSGRYIRHASLETDVASNFAHDHDSVAISTAGMIHSQWRINGSANPFYRFEYDGTQMGIHLDFDQDGVSDWQTAGLDWNFITPAGSDRRFIFFDGATQQYFTRHSANLNSFGFVVTDSGDRTYLEHDLDTDVVTIGNATDTVTLAGATTIGTAGTAISKSVRGSSAVDIASISAQTCLDTSFSLTGAATGDECTLGLPASPAANLSFMCYVSAADTVQIRACNPTVGAIDPASATYSVRTFAP